MRQFSDVVENMDRMRPIVIIVYLCVHLRLMVYISASQIVHFYYPAVCGYTTFFVTRTGCNYNQVRL